MYILRTCRQVLNRWSIRSCGRNEKTLQKDNTYIHTYSSLAVCYYYHYYYGVQSRVLLPCWYPIQTRYHGCHSWVLNVVITQNWVYTHSTPHSQMREPGVVNSGWILFLSMYFICYVSSILETKEKKKKLRSEMRQFGAVVESLLTSMLLFSHGMAGQTKHNWNPSKQCSYGKYNSKMNHHRSARDKATTTRLQIR